MSEQLRPCHGCSRHVRGDASNCPFCGAAVSASGAAWGRVGAGVLLAMAASAALHACYGAPSPCRTDGGCDYDRDAAVDGGGDGSSDASTDR